jgi:hypothetical protein
MEVQTGARAARHKYLETITLHISVPFILRLKRDFRVWHWNTGILLPFALGLLADLAHTSMELFPVGREPLGGRNGKGGINNCKTLSLWLYRAPRQLTKTL